MYFQSTVTDSILKEKRAYRHISTLATGDYILDIDGKHYVVPAVLVVPHIAPVFYIDFKKRQIVTIIEGSAA
mgnify:CR=1 FL=1